MNNPFTVSRIQITSTPKNDTPADGNIKVDAEEAPALVSLKTKARPD